MIIKLILDNLTTEDRKMIMYAFEHHTSGYIELPDNHFIGVNIQPCSDFIITEVRGVWSYGQIIKH